jgi:FdhE protein
MLSYAAVIDGLRQAATARPESNETLDLYIDLLGIEAGAGLTPFPPVMTPAQAARRLHDGLPLLDLDAPLTGADAFLSLCHQVITATVAHRPQAAQPLGAIGAWLRGPQADATALARAYLHGDLAASAQAADLDAALLAFVVAHALRPLLRAQAQSLAGVLDMARWYRGRCPICGGDPDMAALEKDSGARRLLCSRCDTEWMFHRTNCPFCDHEERVTYYPADNGYRLYVCDECGRYLKTIDLRAVADDRLLPVERIVTMQLDAAARAGGWT